MTKATTERRDRKGITPIYAHLGADEVEAWMVLQLALHLRGTPTLPVPYLRNEALEPAPVAGPIRRRPQ
ncbi:MAG: hypothetical protein RID42_14770 [Alphaproteobacteria bacterium]